MTSSNSFLFYFFISEITIKLFHRVFFYLVYIFNFSFRAVNSSVAFDVLFAPPSRSLFCQTFFFVSTKKRIRTHRGFYPLQKLGKKREGNLLPSQSIIKNNKNGANFYLLKNYCNIFAAASSNNIINRETTVIRLCILNKYCLTCNILKFGRKYSYSNIRDDSNVIALFSENAKLNISSSRRIVRFKKTLNISKR